MDSLSQLDRHLSERIRIQIEARYLAPINAKARLEQAMYDPLFYQDPRNYPPLFADHGVVHHRDVACQILQVLDTAHGLLIPAREPERLESMKGYGVMLAYLHDLGMGDFSHFGRATHADLVTQTVFETEFDDILEAMWEENAGGLAWRLARLAEQGALEQPAILALRELLSMANCHSKSRVPLETLNDANKLRLAMQERVETDLQILYQRQQVEKASQVLLRAQREQNRAASDSASRALREAEQALEVAHAANPRHDASAGRVGRHYRDFSRDSFRWLVSDHRKTRALVADVVDTLRALRCADALRQRGTVLKTSGGYEVFVDRETANAIYALHMGEDQMFLLEVPDALAAGEANLASGQLDPLGNLRVSFHRGAFSDPETTRRAAHNLALVIDDIQGDAVESFQRPTPADIARAAQDMEILLEGVDDNLEFADLVMQELERIKPKAAARTRCVPAMKNASDVELARYLQAEALDWDLNARCQALERIARSGHKTSDVHPAEAFRDVRLARLKSEEVLIEAGAPSGFVYIPLSEGLQATPLGGYAPAAARPWMPLGITGVIRGATRNSTVTAEREVALLMIPREVYLRAWHRTYGVDELLQVLEHRKADLDGEEATLTSLEKRLLLETVPLFAEVPGRVLTDLVPIVKEIRRSERDVVLEKGDAGDHMYVIVKGQVRVHDGAHTLNHLGKGEVFGEMALLEPELRMASVTAVEDTHLLRLHRESFQRLMAGHPEMARGIIRVLTQRLRSQAQDVAALHAHVRQLDG